MNKPTHEALADNKRAPGAAAAVSPVKRLTWEQTEGTSLPLGATWIEDDEAFNFAVYAEHAESVTLLLYSAEDVESPILTFPFDFVGNKSDESGTAGSPSIKCAAAPFQKPQRNPLRSISTVVSEPLR